MRANDSRSCGWTVIVPGVTIAAIGIHLSSMSEFCSAYRLMRKLRWVCYHVTKASAARTRWPPHNLRFQKDKGLRSTEYSASIWLMEFGGRFTLRQKFCT